MNSFADPSLCIATNWIWLILSKVPFDAVLIWPWNARLATKISQFIPKFYIFEILLLPSLFLFTFHASKLARGSRGLFRIINEKHRKNWNSKIVCRFYREVARSKPQIGLNKMLCSHHIPYILIVQTLKHCLCVSLRERGWGHQSFWRSPIMAAKISKL